MRPSIANWKSGVAIAVLYVVALVLAMRRIDDVRYYGRTISSNEVLTIYNAYK